MKRVSKVFIHALKTPAGGIGLGLVLISIQRNFGIDGSVVLRCCIGGLAVAIGCWILSIFYDISYLTRVKKIARLLDEEKPKQYTEGIEALLKTAKCRSLRDGLTFEMEQHDRAIAILEGLSGKKWGASATKAVHRINLCMSYFKTAQYEKALALYNENQPLFCKYRNGKQYGASIAILDVMAAIMDEQYDRAEELLGVAKSAYAGTRFEKELDQISHTLRQARDRQNTFDG